jgi:outer membrane protein assembly factor BamB
VVGQNLFVASGDGGPLVEIDTGTGKLVKAFSGSEYQFDGPAAMLADGPDLFVTDPGTGGTGGSVVELDAATGAVVRVLSAASYGFDEPVAMAAAGPDLFVANYDGSSVTELDASNGALVRVLAAPTYDFVSPDAMAVDGGDLFVADSGNNSVIEVDVATGAPVRAVAASADSSDEPVAIAAAGPDLFVANADVALEGSGTAYEGSSVTELNASSGTVVSVLSSPGYMFEEPDALAVAGPDLFVANLSDGSVTELPTSLPSTVRTGK